jgi:hypothetical protein
MGQVQNLSGAEVRGFHPKPAIVSQDIVHSPQRSAPGVAGWSNNRHVATSTGGPAQLDRPHQYNGQHSAEEYASGSVSADRYQSEMPCDADTNNNSIDGAQPHQPRRSASDEPSLALYQQQQQQNFPMQPQRRSLDGVQLEHGQHALPQYQQPPQRMVEEHQYMQDSSDYFGGGHDSQSAHSQHVVSPQQAPYIETASSEPGNYDVYQEPQVQDLGVVLPQTYSIPMTYTLGSVMDYDERKYKYMDNTFGEQFASQLF